MLAAKMTLDRERLDLQQTESRIDNELQRTLMQLISLAP
jgi:hypothetical protein